MDIDKYIKSGILEQYILGLSSPEERKEVERLAKKYPEINKGICDLQNCMEQYSEMCEGPPSKRIRKKGLYKVSENEGKLPIRESNNSYRSKSRYKWGLGIAAIMLIGLSALSLFFYQNQKSSQQEIRLLSTQMLHFQNDYNDLKENNEKMMTSYSVLKDVSTKHVNLRGSANAPEALAIIYWNMDQNKAYLNAVNIPKAPHGHDYQVWADVNGKHVSMGLLNVNDTMSLLQSLPCIKNCSGVVITIEKEGGSSQPTVEKLFVKGEM